MPYDGRKVDAPIDATDETVNIASLSSTDIHIVPISKYLNENPGTTIPAYDTQNKQWCTIGLNKQRQLVVIMTLSNGARAIRILEPRSKRFVIDPTTLNQPQTKKQPPTKEEKAQEQAAALQTTFREALRGIAEDTRIKTLLSKKQAHKRLIAIKAEELAETLSLPKRNLTVRTTHDSIEFEYELKVGPEKDSIQTLKELVTATGERLEQAYSSGPYYTDIPAEKFARFLVIELLNKLIEKFPDTDALTEFLKQTQSVPEGLFKIHICSMASLPNETKTIKITIT